MKCLAILLTAASLSTLSLALAAPSKLQLKYFDLRGVAETSRVLLAIGGEEYEDVRFEIDPSNFQSAAFLAAKESGELKMNLNRAPVLVTQDGTTIGQSKAIERFLARKFGLLGGSPDEEAVIDCIAEHCRDVKDAAMRKGFSNFTKGKTDEEKARDRSEWFEGDMPTMLKKIDDMVQEMGAEEGFAVGSATSYADVAIWALLRDCPPADAEDTSKAAVECKALTAIADAISANPGVSKWLNERPETMF